MQNWRALLVKDQGEKSCLNSGTGANSEQQASGPCLRKDICFFALKPYTIIVNNYFCHWNSTFDYLNIIYSLQHYTLTYTPSNFLHTNTTPPPSVCLRKHRKNNIQKINSTV
ncbi:hypothetical protein HanHA300_Chr12g0442301 [Helianthus annuus]|nr:hypothetical protein HanHA300_Chr12g0442301 [Helianthus annuus]KAJ0493037.1 hypothetical protein HanIR_Chr12g0581541 [Helianthus annuus]KAJ0505169.1 hypothetical protein HanHA89_Chr12g0467411 [Helianthus annuus]KAJ0674854.1 hypothetical protein HanLR1_Chr12g0444541 [Helianthus annuus]